MREFVSLEDRIQQAGGDVLAMFRSSPALSYPFPYPSEWANWASEQWAWKHTSVLFDQSHHMSDIYFSGPDVTRLLSDTGVNSFATFGRGRAKQYVGVNPAGQFIGDAILFGLEDDVVSLVGAPTIANWVEYRATTGGYDVTVERDEATVFNRLGRRRLWRYQLNGPLTQDVVEKAVGRELGRIPFFGMTEFDIDGAPVRALNHTMSGVPGERHTGLELFGPVEDAARVREALLEAGREFGLVPGGSTAYLSAEHESGWIPAPMPAVYTHPDLKAYREQLFGFALEGSMMLAGSFEGASIEDYYLYPDELGYGNIVKFDHDFIGRDALEARVGAPRKKKVWLLWNDDDYLRVLGEGLFGTGKRPRILSIPNSFRIAQQYDSVRIGGEHVGFSVGSAGYTVNVGHVLSHAVIDEEHAVDGQQVEIVWGEADGGRGRRFMEPHHDVQTVIRATIATTSPALR